MKKLIIFLFQILLLNCAMEQEVTVVRNIPNVDKKSILFVDFDNSSLGSKKADWDGLKRAIPSMILTDFQTFGTFRPITEADRIRALKEVSLAQKGVLDETGLKIGKLLGAEYLFSGSFTEFNGNLSVSAKVVRIETGESVSSISKNGPTETVLSPPERSIIKKTSLGLLSQMNYNLTTKEVDFITNKIETKNLQAAINNYKGEMILETVELKKNTFSSSEILELRKEAKNSFKVALQEDPDYEKAQKNLSRIVSLLPPTF